MCRGCFVKCNSVGFFNGLPLRQNTHVVNTYIVHAYRDRNNNGTVRVDWFGPVRTAVTNASPVFVFDFRVRIIRARASRRSGFSRRPDRDLPTRPSVNIHRPPIRNAFSTIFTTGKCIVKRTRHTHRVSPGARHLRRTDAVVRRGFRVTVTYNVTKNENGKETVAQKRITSLIIFLRYVVVYDQSAF